MDALNREAAFSFFVCGLAWLSIALGMAVPRRSSRSAWLIACFALQGAAAWAGAIMACEAAAGGLLPAGGAGAHSEAVLQLARLAMLIGSVVVLVEYGQRRLGRHRTSLPGRWVVVVLAAWTVLGPLVVDCGWLEFGFAALLAWPGVMLPALFLRAMSKNERMIHRGSLAIALATLLASAIAGLLPLGVAQPALAIFAAGAMWRVFARSASARPAPVWRRAAAPAAFTLALAAGWFAIVGHRSGSSDVEPLDPQEIAMLVEASEDARAPEKESDLERQLKRCGIAVAPIVGLVLAVWGLSRLPFAR